jgi:hypothetical protein
MMRRKPLIPPPKIRKWFVAKAVKDINDASPEELNYLAALVDGEGNLDVAGTQPRIRIGMKNLAPVKLAKQYGGYWYPSANKKHGTISYTWYIQSKPLIDDFVKLVMPYSRVKYKEFELLSKALEIQDAKPNEWKNEIKEIGKELRRMHHMNPIVIFRAACKLDERKPNWRGWVRKGTIIETKLCEHTNLE